MKGADESKVIGFGIIFEDGSKVYELTYDRIAPDLSAGTVEISGRGSVSGKEQRIRMPNGDSFSADEAVFERDRNKLRIPRDPSVTGKAIRGFKRSTKALLEAVRL